MNNELKVDRASANEVFKDMVRVPKRFRPVDNGHICRVSANNKSVLASVRGLDSDDATIRIDEHLRDRLGVEPGTTYRFMLSPANMWERKMWHWSASDPAVRIPARLAVVSLGLGVLSFILGVVALCISSGNGT